MTEPELLLHLVDLVLAVSLLELAWLMLRRSAPHLARRPLLVNLLAGLALMLGLRLGLSGAALPWVALCLAAAGVAHLFDLRARWLAAGANPLPLPPSRMAQPARHERSSS